MSSQPDSRSPSPTYEGLDIDQLNTGKASLRALVETFQRIITQSVAQAPTAPSPPPAGKRQRAGPKLRPKKRVKVTSRDSSPAPSIVDQPIPCTYCARTKKVCVLADPHAEKSPCTSCRRARVKCSLLPPRKRIKHSEPHHSDDATSSSEDSPNPDPPVRENAVAGPSSIRPVNDPLPHLSAVQPSIGDLDFYKDIADSIDSFAADLKAQMLLLMHHIERLEDRLRQIQRNQTDLINLLIDAGSDQ